MSTNSITFNPFLILTRNSNVLINHKNELFAILQNNKNNRNIVKNIALIAETHFVDSSSLNLLGFHIIKTNKLIIKIGTAHAGAAIIVRSTLLFYPSPPFQTDYIQSYNRIKSSSKVISSQLSKHQYGFLSNHMTITFYLRTNRF